MILQVILHVVIFIVSTLVGAVVAIAISPYLFSLLNWCIELGMKLRGVLTDEIDE